MKIEIHKIDIKKPSGLSIEQDAFDNTANWVLSMMKKGWKSLGVVVLVRLNR